LNLRVQNKLLGDFAVQCSGGSIVLDKLRGSNLSFNTGDSDITVNKVIEGCSSIHCRSITAQMVNGEEVRLVAKQTISVGAIYAQQAIIQSGGDCKVGLLRGSAHVSSARGDVSLSGVDGSFDVVAEQGNVSLQLNKLSTDIPPGRDRNSYYGDDRDKVHDAMAGISTASAPNGSVAASVDPELVALLKCETISPGAKPIEVLSDAFEVKDDTDTDTDGKQMVSGFLTGKSKAPKRATSRRGGHSSGKIDLRGAESQAMQGYVERQGSGDGAEEPSGVIPSLWLQGKDVIRVETLSWIEAIRRRHGFSEPMADVNVGRRARARLDSAAVRKKVEQSTEMDATSLSAADVHEILSREAQQPRGGSATSPEPKADDSSGSGATGATGTVSSDIISGTSSQPEVTSAKVSLKLDSIPGVQTEGEKLIIIFTCKVCSLRSAKKISKQAYNHGVVLVRCGGCQNLHLMADRMGVFEDKSWDIQTHIQNLAKQGGDVQASQSDDVLELTSKSNFGKK
jgi:DNL zinc finger